MSHKYLIDVNLPYYFSLWNNPDYVHQIDIARIAKDSDIWSYAKDCDKTIITKDSDFASRILVSSPPPRVIHSDRQHVNEGIPFTGFKNMARGS